MLIIRRTPRNRARPYRTTVDNVELAFEFVDHGGETVLGCYVDDDANAEKIARTLRDVPSYDVVRDAVRPAPVARPRVHGSRLERVMTGEGAPPRALEILVELGLLESATPHELSDEEFRKLQLMEEFGALVRAEHVGGGSEPRPDRSSGFYSERALPSPAEQSPVWTNAVANGWSNEDLAGTGGPTGDPGPVGGYSRTTGLTLAQMALSTPPHHWEDLRATDYPWEIEGWKPPGLDWTPPAVPAKHPRKAPGPAEPTAVKPPVGESGDYRPLGLHDVRDREGDRASRGLQTDETRDLDLDNRDGLDGFGDEDERGLSRETTMPGEPPAGASSDDPAVAAGYPAEHVGAVRALAHKLQGELGHKALHRNKLNWAIRNQNDEHGLNVPTVSDEQLAALLAVPSISAT